MRWLLLVLLAVGCSNDGNPRVKTDLYCGSARWARSLEISGGSLTYQNPWGEVVQRCWEYGEDGDDTRLLFDVGDGRCELGMSGDEPWGGCAFTDDGNAQRYIGTGVVHDAESGYWKADFETRQYIAGAIFPGLAHVRLFDGVPSKGSLENSAEYEYEVGADCQRKFEGCFTGTLRGAIESGGDQCAELLPILDGHDRQWWVRDGGRTMLTNTSVLEASPLFDTCGVEASVGPPLVNNFHHRIDIATNRATIRHERFLPSGDCVLTFSTELTRSDSCVEPSVEPVPVPDDTLGQIAFDLDGEAIEMAFVSMATWNADSGELTVAARTHDETPTPLSTRADKRFDVTKLTFVDGVAEGDNCLNKVGYEDRVALTKSRRTTACRFEMTDDGAISGTLIGTFEVTFTNPMAQYPFESETFEVTAGTFQLCAAVEDAGTAAPLDVRFTGLTRRVARPRRPIAVFPRAPRVPAPLGRDGGLAPRVSSRS